MTEQWAAQDDPQFNELHEKLMSMTQAGAAKAEAAINVCGTWAIIKPYWPKIVAAVASLPYGNIIAVALMAIGAGLDIYCKSHQPLGAAAAAKSASSTATISAEEEQELLAMHAELFGGSAAGSASAATAASLPGKAQLCDAWGRVKQRWPKIVAIVRHLAGDKLADILQKVGELADSICQ